MEEETKIIAVRVPTPTAKKLEAAAEADHRTVSSLLRVLIDAEVERHEHAAAVEASS
jgi:predicted DNA-binding protein